MTNLGDIKTDLPSGVVLDSGFVSITTPVGTTSATLVDITGASFTVTVPTGAVGRILAAMNVGCSTTGGSPSTGAWAVSVAGVDGVEIPRYMSGTNDNGALGCRSWATGLTAGTYTVKGRYRRVAGASTINTDVAEISAFLILE
jgi:hypothetical protein